MTQVHGQRCRSRQETSHLINSLPFVWCDHSFRKVDLRNSRTVFNPPTAQEANQEEADQNAALKTIIDAYLGRREPTSWMKDTDFEQASTEGLDDLNLDVFANKYYVGMRGTHRNKVKVIQGKQVVLFTPNLPNKKTGSTYTEYCKLSLVRFTVWEGDYNSAFGGENTSDEEIVQKWEEYLLSLAASGDEPPDFLRHEMTRLLEDMIPSDGTDFGNNMTGAGETFGDEEELQWAMTENWLDDDNDDDLEVDWNQNHDFQQNKYDYTGDNLPVENPCHTFTRLANSGKQAERNIPNICQDDLNDLQQVYFDILVELLSYSHGDSKTDGGDGYHRCVIFKGRGGTGKSRSTNAVRLSVDTCEEAAFATTGKAATAINASTVFSKKHGLALPVGRTKYKPLQGRNLQEAQRRFKHLKLVHLDEYTMLDQKQLHFMNLCLQEIKANRSVFGGVVIVLCGDTAQLPPVQGRCLWEKSRSKATSEALAGMKLYFEEFLTVVELKENMRLNRDDPDADSYESFLNRLADGECTDNDWRTVRDKCSRDTLGQAEWD